MARSMLIAVLLNGKAPLAEAGAHFLTPGLSASCKAAGRFPSTTGSLLFIPPHPISSSLKGNGQLCEMWGGGFRPKPETKKGRPM